MSKNRYMTPISYVNGNGAKRTTKLYFELTPVELADWTINNAFEANELQASLQEMQDIHAGESRDLTPDEIYVMMGIVRILAQISAGKPSEDGEYFIKDPNWISSYAYRAFRTLLFTNAKEMNQFMTTLLDNDVMTEFNKTIAASNEKMATDAGVGGKEITEMSREELLVAMRNRTEALAVDANKPAEPEATPPSA